MQSEIKDAWIQGFMECEFGHIGRRDWPKAEKLARKAWRTNNENLTLMRSPVMADRGLLDAINAGAPA
jgi:hypothetical protein